MPWAIKSVDGKDVHILAGLLQDGWEPFAVTQGGAFAQPICHLRKQVDESAFRAQYWVDLPRKGRLARTDPV